MDKIPNYLFKIENPLDGRIWKTNVYREPVFMGADGYYYVDGTTPTPEQCRQRYSIGCPRGGADSPEWIEIRARIKKYETQLVGIRAAINRYLEAIRSSERELSNPATYSGLSANKAREKKSRIEKARNEQRSAHDAEAKLFAKIDLELYNYKVEKGIIKPDDPNFAPPPPAQLPNWTGQGGTLVNPPKQGDPIQQGEGGSGESDGRSSSRTISPTTKRNILIIGGIAILIVGGVVIVRKLMKKK